MMTFKSTFFFDDAMAANVDAAVPELKDGLP